MTDDSMNAAELAAEQIRAEALHEVQAADAAAEKARDLIAEGERQLAEAEAAGAEARVQLRYAERFIDKVRRLEAERAAAEAAPAIAAVATPAAASSTPTANGSGSMVPVLDELLSDGEERTIDDLFATMQSRGLPFTRASVMNRCAARAKRGFYLRRVREDGKSVYKLAAKDGDQLPPGSDHPGGGGRGPQPDGDTQLGAGMVGEAGSLAV